MNTHIARRAVFATAVISLIGGAMFAPASQAATVSRYLTVSADGTVKMAPDAVRINATVSVVGTTTVQASVAAGTSSAAVRAAFLAHGIATKDIATQSLTVYPEYNYTQTGGQSLIGYRASQTFVVTVRKPTTAGVVVDAVVTAGGDNLQLNNVTPFILDSSKAVIGARSAAVKNAKIKASSYASLLGIKLGKVNYLIENSSPSLVFPSTTVSMAKDSSGATQIDLGQQDVTVSITIQWGLL